MVENYILQIADDYIMITCFVKRKYSKTKYDLYQYKVTV